MASTASPYGLQAISDQSGPAPRTVRMPFGIASGYGTNIFNGAPIALNPSTGLIQAVTSATQQIFGAFVGIEFAPLGQRPTVSNFWPAGTVWDPNDDMLVYFIPAWIPSLRWRIQANGSVSQSAMGQQFSLATFAVGNSFTGLATNAVSATPIAQGVQGQFALTEFDTSIGSTVGDAYTDLIVTVAYPQVGSGFQTSIG